MAAMILLLKAVVCGVVVVAFVDPAWSVPVQTVLLIVLTIVTSRIHGTVKGTKATVDDTHVQVVEAKANATHAASSAAAAAAVARDSNRIVKDVGSMFRAAQAEVPPATGEGGAP